MLDLQPRVHLQEVEARRRRRRRLRAGTRSCRRCGSRQRARPRPRPAPISLAQLRRQRRRRALLDDLLVAPLQRALAFEQMHDVAVIVARRSGSRCAAAARSGARRRACRRRTPPSLRAAPLDRVDRRSPRVAARRACRCRRRRRTALISAGNPTRATAASSAASDWSAGVSPGTTGTPARSINRARLDLGSHALDRVRRRADEHQPGACAGARRTRRSPRGSRSPGARRRRRTTRGVDDRAESTGSSLRGGAGPMRTARSAAATCGARASASE